MTDADDYRKESRARWGARGQGLGGAGRADGPQRRCRSRVWMVDALELAAGPRGARARGRAPARSASSPPSRSRPTGTLISSDFAPEMITVAQARAEQLGITNVRFRQIDAESIDQPAASLDGVLCRWGYMLMADPRGGAARDAARAQARRAASRSPRGRARARTRGRRCRRASWSSAAHVERPEPGAPGQFRWARPGTIEEHLDAAGFTEYEVDTVDFANVYPVGRRLDRDQPRLLDDASAARSSGLDPAEREDVLAAIREKALPFVREDGSAVVPARSWVAAAAA